MIQYVSSPSIANKKLQDTIFYAQQQGDYAKEQGDAAKEAATNVNEAVQSANQAAENANSAATTASNAANNANEKATLAQEKVDSLSTLETQINQAITDSQTATENANTSASNANDKATYAQQQGDYAKTQGDYAKAQGDAASSAIANVNNAITNAEQATANANNAAENANTAATNAQNVTDNIRYIEPYNPSTTYQKNNIVTYNGSSFIAKQTTTGNTPIGDANDAYWGLLAQKGTDGKGSVSSVNNLSPDTNGNVTITPNDIGAIPISQKGVPNGVASIDENGRVLDGNGNVVEGKVTSVNGHIGDVNLNANDVGAISISEKGVPNGVALLNADGKVVDSNGNLVEGKVTSVNGQIGDVNITAADVGAVSTDDYVNHPAFAVASGTANTYSVTLNPAPTGYTDGMAISIKINVDSTGPSTLNVNGLGAVPLKKSNGNDVTNLKANGVYTFRYNASTGNFILQGEGGSGNAQPSDVLSGKTFTNDSGEQTGTMPNNGAITITPTTTDQAIPQGYHNGSGKVKGSPNLIAPNIKKGVNIFDVIGSFVEVQPGDAIVFSAINNASTSSKSMVKVKEIIVSVGRVYRVSFNLNSTNGYTAYAQIYVNGTPRGTLRQTNSSSDVTFTEDIELQDNDALQIYARISGPSYSGNKANVNDLKIGVDVGSFQNTMT